MENDTIYAGQQLLLMVVITFLTFSQLPLSYANILDKVVYSVHAN